jgi:hypothetical protein
MKFSLERRFLTFFAPWRNAALEFLCKGHDLAKMRMFERLKYWFRYQTRKSRNTFVRPIYMVEAPLSKDEYERLRNAGPSVAGVSILAPRSPE